MNKKPRIIFGLNQQNSLDASLRLMGKAFTEKLDPRTMSPEKLSTERDARLSFIENQVIPHLLGSPHKWSKPHGYRISQGHVVHSGAFCIYYGIDPEIPAYHIVCGKDGKAQTVPTSPEERIVALIHVRKEKKANGQHKIGAPGGHLHHGEQAYTGVRRETMEEIRDDMHRPIFRPVKKRYEFLPHGKDFVSRGDRAVQYAAYAYELNAHEMHVLKNHIKRFDNDRDYRRSSILASKKETYGIQLVPLSEIAGWSQRIDHEGEPVAKLLNARDFQHGRQYGFFVEQASRMGMGPNPSHASTLSGNYRLGDLSKPLQQGLANDTRTRARGR